jgi:hypothetical protein
MTMNRNPNLTKALKTLLASDDDELEAKVSEALAEAGVIFACSIQSATHFCLTYQNEIVAASTAAPTVDEIIGSDNEEQRQKRLQLFFKAFLESEGLADSPVELARAARNLQSALPDDIQELMKIDRAKAQNHGHS